MQRSKTPSGTAMKKTGRVYRGFTDDQRRQARKTQLIDAAIVIYGSKGFHNASVKAVCEAAGLTERYFYESFANSEALLISSYKAVIKHIIAAAENAAGTGSANVDERLRAWLGEYFRLIRDQRAIAKVFLADFGGVSAATSEVFTESLERFAVSLFRVLDSPPVSRSDDEKMLMNGLVGGIHHVALAWIEEQYAKPIDRVIEVAALLFLAPWANNLSA